MPLAANAPRWDVFCTVVDNFGDAGVCWRLAKQLAQEHDIRVRLWIDDSAALTKLVPQVAQLDSLCIVDGVEIRQWADAANSDVLVADVVIEAFACALPTQYEAKLARRKAVWINLEYLSAEDWVVQCHGLPSVHPRLGVEKYFFFPGFDRNSGGLLKESGLDEGSSAFRKDPRVQAAFWQRHVGNPPANEALKLSLFCYANSALPSLLRTWADGNQAIFLAVPLGKALSQIENWLGRALTVGKEIACGQLRIAALPFLSQLEYDALLWASDLNFVRGEDSFVRAQWARRPFIWQIYPQDDAAHLPKLEAFLARYTGALPSEDAQALRGFTRAWNGDSDGDVSAAWPQLAASLAALDAHSVVWANQLSAQPDLATRLIDFCQPLLAKRTAG